ncbi:MAG: DUF4258 domain-containing protein [Ruminococcaceae bacterium]|nr:DUF4258 domain-containing protein [Oscillospiraceae bacterium]
MDITIEEIRQLCSNRKNIALTAHSYRRLRQRKIKTIDAVTATANGEIIERYPEDRPYPSCLVLGCTVNGKMLHVVCSVGENKLWIITAYYPDTEKWETDFKTRKVM